MDNSGSIFCSVGRSGKAATKLLLQHVPHDSTAAVRMGWAPVRIVPTAVVAIHQLARNLESLLGMAFSVDTLEQTSQRMGQDADADLNDPISHPTEFEVAFRITETAEMSVEEPS